MFADKETAARRADINAAAWKKAGQSAKVSGGFCLLIVLGFVLIAVYAAGYLAALAPARLANIAERSTP